MSNAVKNDADPRQQALQGWLQQHWPQAEDLRISDFAKPDAGASNETLLFDVSWREGGVEKQRALVARLQQNGGVFPEYDLALQYRTMERLAATDVAVPPVAGFEADASVLGQPFYLMERLPGKVIAENPPYHMEGWFAEASDAERAEIWRNGIRAIASVNTRDWRALGFADLDKPEHGDTPLKQQLHRYHHMLCWAERLGRPYHKLHALFRWLEGEQPSNEPTALCWGDAKIANLLVDGTAVTGVLDWEMVHLGNPVDDLAWWFVLDDSLSEGIGQPKLPGLPSRAETVALWEQTSGFSAEHLDYYLAFGAFKFGVIMARIGTLLMEQGIFPKESEFDLNNNCTPLVDHWLRELDLSY